MLIAFTTGRLPLRSPPRRQSSLPRESHLGVHRLQNCDESSSQPRTKQQRRKCLSSDTSARVKMHAPFQAEPTATQPTELSTLGVDTHPEGWPKRDSNSLPYGYKSCALPLHHPHCKIYKRRYRSMANVSSHWLNHWAMKEQHTRTQHTITKAVSIKEAVVWSCNHVIPTQGASNTCLLLHNVVDH